MGTFKRLDDDEFDDELAPDMQGTQGDNESKSSPAKFKRLDDDGLDGELMPSAVASETKSSSPLPDPVSNSVFNDIIDGGGKTAQSKAPLSEEKTQKNNNQASGTSGKKLPVGAISVVAVIAVLAAAVYFCLPMLKPFSGSVVYSSDMPLTVTLDGSPCEASGDGGVYSIRISDKGKHSVTFSSSGFESKTVEAEVSSDKMEFNAGKIDLEKIIPGGTLFLECSEKDVSFLIDGAEAEPSVKDGVISFSGIASGEHSISIKKKGFSTVNRKFSVSDSKGAELGTVEMQVSDWKNIEIEVSPLSADVYINGEKASVERKNGKIYTEPIEPGDVRIELKAEGFKPWKNDSFEVYSDLKNEIGPVVLQPDNKPVPAKESKDGSKEDNAVKDSGTSESNK